MLCVLLHILIDLGVRIRLVPNSNMLVYVCAEEGKFELRFDLALGTGDGINLIVENQFSVFSILNPYGAI